MNGDASVARGVAADQFAGPQRQRDGFVAVTERVVRGGEFAQRVGVVGLQRHGATEVGGSLGIASGVE